MSLDTQRTKWHIDITKFSLSIPSTRYSYQNTDEIFLMFMKITGSEPTVNALRQPMWEKLCITLDKLREKGDSVNTGTSQVEKCVFMGVDVMGI